MIMTPERVAWDPEFTLEEMPEYAPSEVDFNVASRSIIRGVTLRIVHEPHGRRMFTNCGLLYVDFFATQEAGAFLMEQTSDPVTCEVCRERGQDHD